MSKLQGLAFLKKQFEFNSNQMARILLYKNLPSEKIETYQLAMAKMALVALECHDLAYHLGMIRYECQYGIAGTVPEEYNPFVSLDGDPLQEQRPYDVYAEMGYYLRPDDTPHGLGLSLSPVVLDNIGPLLISKASARDYGGPRGGRLMTRNSDEEEFRLMTDTEVAQHHRKQETELMEGCAFTVGFNDDMSRLRQLVAERGNLAEILELIGPELVEEEAF